MTFGQFAQQQALNELSNLKSAVEGMPPGFSVGFELTIASDKKTVIIGSGICNIGGRQVSYRKPVFIEEALFDNGRVLDAVYNLYIDITGKYHIVGTEPVSLDERYGRYHPEHGWLHLGSFHLESDETYSEIITSNPVHFSDIIVPDGSIKSAMIEAGAITAEKIAAGAIDSNTINVEELLAKQIVVPDEGLIRYITDTGIKKRAVQLSDDKISWLNTPDVIPSTSETLSASIGKLGYSDTVLIDGDFRVKIDADHLSSNLISEAGKNCAGGPVAISDAEGNTQFFYRQNDTGLLMRSYNNGILGTPELIDIGGIDPSAFLLPTGEIIVAFLDMYQSYDIYYRIRTLAGTWTDSVLVSTVGGVFFFLEDHDNVLWLYTTVNTLRFKRHRWTGAEFYPFAEFTEIGGIIQFTADYLPNGDLLMCYLHTTDGIVYYRTLENGDYTKQWSDQAPISETYHVNTLSLTKGPKGDLTLYYRRINQPSDVGLYKSGFSKGLWSDPELIELESGPTNSLFNPYVFTDTSGETLLLHNASYYEDPEHIVECKYFRIPSFAKIGGGFVGRSGSTYTLFDGTQITISGGSITAYIGPEGPQGPQGMIGPIGPQGVAGTITVGGVAISPTPSVTNVGTSQNAILDFTFPQGEPGERGDPGTLATGTPFYKGPKTISSNITITELDDNYMTIGPIEIADGVTVTIDGGSWVIV